jgi:hypothetical protein
MGGTNSTGDNTTLRFKIHPGIYRGSTDTIIAVDYSHLSIATVP